MAVVSVAARGNHALATLYPSAPGRCPHLSLVAVTRAVSRSLSECELTHIDRAPIDLSLAREQHAEYEALLAALGCHVIQLPEAPELPDAVFIEDTAVVLDEVAVITRPGAASRRDEVGPVAKALEVWRPVVRLTDPATLDGGDVMRVGRTLYVGVGPRTNELGVAQLADAVRRHGYDVRAVQVQGALHLKSAVTSIGDALLLVNPAWVDPGLFGESETIEVHAEEPFAANALRVGDTIIHSTAFPLTQRRLTSRGLSVLGVNAGELAKAEGGVTCCSLVFVSKG